MAGLEDELISVQQAARELGIARSTAWLLIRRHDLPRYRLAGRGKTTFVRRGDVLRAYRTPRLVGGSPADATTDEAVSPDGSDRNGRSSAA